MNLPIIATLGGHSALEICLGARKQGFNTLVIVQKGRAKIYTKYFHGLIDESIMVDSFAEITHPKVINQLKAKNVIFIPHRYCQVYCDLSKLETDFPITVFGNKFLLKFEEREGKFNQYQIMDEGDIPYPKKFNDPKKINRLSLVKVNEKERKYERAFFFASSYDEYKEKSGHLLQEKRIDREDLTSCTIEEYLIGAQINFNFFYSISSDKIELLGTDIRRQTNIDGLMRIPARQQLDIEHILYPSYIEAGHIAVTVKESLLDRAFELAERVVLATRKLVRPGIIGPFALQCAIIPGPPKEKIVVYDLSLRIPGSPGTSFTPYSQYHFGHPVSFGERIAMEIKEAIKLRKLDKITT